MLKKHDRQGARRPADIEQKYKFEKQFSETRTAIKKSQAVAEEARKIASDITETDKGLSLKVEALGKDVDGVKAQLDLKVETDENGDLKSKVHVSGNEFTVDTDNFKLDENGNVAISGDFSTKNESGTLETKISAGVIFVNGLSASNTGDEKRKYLLLTFNAEDKTMGLYANGYKNANGNFVFQSLGVEPMWEEEEEL